MTAHAQHLAGAVVAARAGRRIATRFASVLVVRAGEPDPARRMRALAIEAGDAARDVTARAAIRGVACGAGAWIRARLECVTRGEPGAVHARAERIAEPQLRRQHGDGLTVARRAGPLGVARLARVGGRRSAGAVIADPVAVVHEVRLWQRARVLEIDVTRLAVARIAGGVVGVTAKACGHGWTQPRVTLGDAEVAAHAVAATRSRVLAMIEANVGAHLGELAGRAGANMAVEARPRIVRLRMAGRARGRVGEVQHVARIALHVGVTAGAAHAGEDVRAVREGFGGAAREAEHAGARRDRDQREHEHAALHGLPQRVPSCASTSTR